MPLHSKHPSKKWSFEVALANELSLLSDVCSEIEDAVLHLSEPDASFEFRNQVHQSASLQKIDFLKQGLSDLSELMERLGTKTSLTPEMISEEVSKCSLKSMADRLMKTANHVPEHSIGEIDLF